jgi:hypothetical protein
MDRIKIQGFDPVYFFRVFFIGFNITAAAVTMKECGNLNSFVLVRGKGLRPSV